MVTCLVYVGVTEPSAVCHFRFGDCFCVAGEQEGVISVSDKKADGVVVDILIACACRSDYLCLCIP